jgi:DNA-binding IscR family transcriptional regulator
VLLPMWDKAHRAMMDVYDGTTLEDLLEQELATHGCEAVDYAI